MSLKIYNNPISQNDPHFIANINNNTILIRITYIVVIIYLTLF